MGFEENFKEYLARLEKMKPQLKDLAEESTKTALVMPFFSMLGYDVFNANEFMPEYTCDVATKKGEKVDYAVLKDGEPIMLVEVKRSGMKLQKQQQGQLFCYFSTNRCRIAILTNGIVYQFFSDLNAPNVMDDEPFLSFNLLEDDYTLYIASVKQFSKEKFNIKSVIQKAVYQKYSEVVQKTLKEDLISPSDEIVKYFLSQPEIKTGNRITAQMIEKYREATQKAMQKVFGAVIKELPENKSNQSEIKKEKNSPSETVETVEPVTVPAIESISRKIQEISGKISDSSCKFEENSDFLRIHIYSSDKKFAVLKIIKSDLSIQLRKFVNGVPEVYQLDSAEKFSDYI